MPKQLTGRQKKTMKKHSKHHTKKHMATMTKAMKKKLKKSGATSLWGGRFDNDTSKLMRKINSSISFDKKLYKHDILGSKCFSTLIVKSIQSSFK